MSTQPTTHTPTKRLPIPALEHPIKRPLEHFLEFLLSALCRRQIQVQLGAEVAYDQKLEWTHLGLKNSCELGIFLSKSAPTLEFTSLSDVQEQITRELKIHIQPLSGFSLLTPSTQTQIKIYDLEQDGLKLGDGWIATTGVRYLNLPKALDQSILNRTSLGQSQQSNARKILEKAPVKAKLKVFLNQNPSLAVLSSGTKINLHSLAVTTNGFIMQAVKIEKPTYEDISLTALPVSLNEQIGLELTLGSFQLSIQDLLDLRAGSKITFTDPFPLETTIKLGDEHFAAVSVTLEGDGLCLTVGEIFSHKSNQQK